MMASIFRLAEPAEPVGPQWIWFWQDLWADPWTAFGAVGWAASCGGRGGRRPHFDPEMMQRDRRGAGPGVLRPVPGNAQGGVAGDAPQTVAVRPARDPRPCQHAHPLVDERQPLLKRSSLNVADHDADAVRRSMGAALEALYAARSPFLRVQVFPPLAIFGHGGRKALAFDG